MAQYTQQPTDRTSFNPMAHSQISNQPQIHERSSRYSGISGQQQPDQSSRSHKPSDNVAEVAQGLKELQEKINNALKRSSSSTPIRPNPNVSAVPSVPSFKPVQTEIEPEKSQRLYESYYEARSAASSNQPSQPATAKYAPSDMKASTASTASFSTSQPYSSRFYLGASQNSSNMAEQERLLNSIKSYQVKTLNSLSSSRSIQSSQTYTQATPVKKANQTLGSSAILSSASFVPIHGFQPSFDTQQLDHVISRIMTNQSFNGTRHESFVTNQDSYLMARVNESNVTQEQIRRTPQQSRPAKPSQSISHINPRKATTSQQTKKSKDPKSSCCGEIELDGDSMILEFIKENDQLFLEDDGEERPAKRARAVEEDKPQPKKLSKRQEILNSKRQMKKK